MWGMPSVCKLRGMGRNMCLRSKHRDTFAHPDFDTYHSECVLRQLAVWSVILVTFPYTSN